MGDQYGLSIAWKSLELGLGLTRKQHRFGYPVVISIPLPDERVDQTYTLSGLKMNLCVQKSKS